MSPRICLFLTACFGLLAVALGAFGAHGLKDSGFLERKYESEPPKLIAGHSVPAAYKYFRDFETAVDYHVMHTFALGLTGLLMVRIGHCRGLQAAAWCFVAGMLLFSGALYVLVIGGPCWLGIPWGMVAPIGGTLQLAGWFALASACFAAKNLAGPS
jgi:uncharacterized membrane protein YgdD (TMEM256/DUF423 family)